METAEAVLCSYELAEVQALFCYSTFIIESSIMCIRGTRSSNRGPLRDADIALATSEGNIPQDLTISGVFFVFFKFLFGLLPKNIIYQHRKPIHNL